MIAAAIHIQSTVERPLPWKATQSESVAVFRAMERYANGDVGERIHATEDMDRIITQIAIRVREEAR